MTNKFFSLVFFSTLIACSDSDRPESKTLVATETVPEKISALPFDYQYPFRLEEVAGSLSAVGLTDLDISDDGRWVLYSGFGGKACIAEFIDDNRIEERGCVVTRDVHPEGENGLNSIALDRNFSQSGIIYVALQTAPHHRVIRRYKMSYSESAQTWIEIESQNLVWSETVASSATHMIGKLLLTGDGSLIASIGDGQEIQSVQSNDSYFGKIIKINFSGSRTETPKSDWQVSELVKSVQILAKGLRMPWRMSITNSQSLWVGDVGSSRYEELNCLLLDTPKTQVYNFGWPINEGPSGSIQSEFTAPVFSWSRLDFGDLRTSDPQCPSGPRSAIWLGPTYPSISQNADPYDDRLDGRILLSDFENGWVRSFPIATSIPCSIDPENAELILGSPFLTAAKLNPKNGLIYFSDLRAGTLSVLRLSNASK